MFFVLMLLPGCNNTVPSCVNTSDNNRIVNFKFDIFTKANTIDELGFPGTVHMWIYNDDELLKYIEYENNTWLPGSSDGIDLTTTIETELDLKGEINNLDFYVVLNEANDVNNNKIAFSDVASLQDLLGLQFILSSYENDNNVPMSGKKSIQITDQSQTDYNLSIDVVRSVGKLELYCTRESELANLLVKKVTLHHIPEFGYLFDDQSISPDIINTGSSVVLIDNTSGLEITTTLPEETIDSGKDFEDYKDNFTQLSFTQPYLLENLFGGDINDAIVGEGNGDNNVEVDKDSRYCLSFEYSLNGKEQSKNIYLPSIPRNTIDRLFIRVNGDGNYVQLLWKVVDWEDGGELVIDGGMHPTTSLNDYLGEDKTDQNTWYDANMDISTPEKMNNAARYTFIMSSEHEWNITCSNITEFGYKIFKLQSDGSYIDIENIQEKPVRTKGTYVICIYPRNPLSDQEQHNCTISFSYYNTYMQEWETLADEAAKAVIYQVSAKSN